MPNSVNTMTPCSHEVPCNTITSCFCCEFELDLIVLWVFICCVHHWVSAGAGTSTNHWFSITNQWPWMRLSAETCLLVRCKALCHWSLLLSLCFNLHLFENAILRFLPAGFVLAYRTFSRDVCILYVFSQKRFLKQIKDLVWISASAYFNHFCHSTSGFIWKQNGRSIPSNSVQKKEHKDSFYVFLEMFNNHIASSGPIKVLTVPFQVETASKHYKSWRWDKKLFSL